MKAECGLQDPPDGEATVPTTGTAQPAAKPLHAWTARLRRHTTPGCYMSSSGPLPAAAAAAAAPLQVLQRRGRGGGRSTQQRSASSLVALLLALQGRSLSFELRNDVTVRGTLASVDDYMNMYIDDAVWQPVQGPAQLYPLLFLKGRSLRMVHLPGGLDAAAAIDAHVEREKQARVAAALALLNRPHARLAKGSATAAGGDGDGEAEDA